MFDDVPDDPSAIAAISTASEFVIESGGDGTTIVRLPRARLDAARLLFLLAVVYSVVKLHEGAGAADSAEDWLLLGSAAVFAAAALWSTGRTYGARIVIGSSQIFVRNIWRSYRIDIADIRSLRVGSNVWAHKTGVIETRSGKQVRPWALLLGRIGERSEVEMQAALRPVGLAIGLDQID